MDKEMQQFQNNLMEAVRDMKGPKKRQIAT